MKAALVLLALIGLAGCSGDGADAEPKPEVVSTQTTCDELFAGDPGLWSQAVAAMTGEEADGQLADQLAELAEASKPTLRPHLEQMAESVDAATEPSSFKTAARALGDICAPYVA